MAQNPFSLNLLGGFDLGQSIDQVAGAARQADEQERLRAERENMQRLMTGAASGDAEAIEGLIAINPDLGMKFEQRDLLRKQRLGQQQAEEAKQAETDWGLRWAQASPEQREELKKEALSNPLIDFDESDLNVGEQQSNLAINAMLYKNLGKDAYSNLIAGAGPEKGTYQIKETPTGFVRINTATGAFTEIPSNSKLAKEQMEKQEKQLKADLAKTETTFDRSRKLRDEYSSKTKEFEKVDDAYDRIVASVEKPDAAGDLALIFNYMKMLDPGSVVREGEFATAQNAAGVPERVRNIMNRLLDGERLSPSQRKMFSSRAKGLYSKAKVKADESKEFILGVGEQYGLSEQDIFGLAKPSESKQQSFQEGQTATNPSTGQKLIYQNGAWVPYG